MRRCTAPRGSGEIGWKWHLIRRVQREGRVCSMDESLSERVRLAQRIAVVKPGVAEAISDEFFLNHPDWAVRYGHRGHQLCVADACFHMDFLAGAIEAGSPDAFSDYARWTARMLGARGIGAHTLEENLG